MKAMDYGGEGVRVSSPTQTRGIHWETGAGWLAGCQNKRISTTIRGERTSGGGEVGLTVL